ncbi:MAG TPA: hypothetical protein PK816_17460, partial [Candidatus Cloacimonadota bacterium]|nr:hypothetical protein [Candidatus Cloacimonadota bacterium]
MIKKIMFVTVVMCLPVYLLCASIFSFYGMPESYSGRDVIGLGMGDTGIGNLLRPNTGLKNASLACNNQYTIFSSAYSLGNLNVSDDTNQSTYNGDISYFPYFNVSVPLYKHRFGFAYQSVSNGKFSAEQKNTSGSDVFTEIRKADNALYQADMFYAYQFDNLNLSLSINYLFGHKINYAKADYEDTNLIDTKYEIEETFKSPGLTLGFSKEFNKKVSMGGTVSIPVELKGDKSYKTITLNEGITSETYKLPLKVSFGGAVNFYKNWDMAMDIDYDLWSQSDMYENANDGYRVAYGIEYQGSVNQEQFFKKISQRAGFAYKVSPLNSIGNDAHELTETSFTYGFSIPIKTHDSRIDFAVKYFNRESNESNYQENGILFSIGTTGFDIFKKPLDRKGHRDIPVPDET